ncbi:MAG: HAD-IA family hydrolase [Candidatus Lokiarchaeota archaeon]|nr:HAD-IA family hydrolase [Candidatus Lokiarchaeota archaeon]
MKLIEKILTKKIKGFIFDLDGTLINTLGHHVDAFQIAFEKLGIKVNREEIKHNMGRTPWDIPRDILYKKPMDDLNEDEKKLVDKIASMKIEIYHKKIADNIPLQDGVKEVLSYLKEREIRLAVCSSTPKMNVHHILKKIGIYDFFDAIITGDNVKVGKPNPEAFLIAVKKIGLNKENCFIVGDSVHDIEAGNRGNIKTIAVCTGFHDREELKDIKPEIIINDLTDLLGA